jgi:hypothetical protein
VRAMSNLNHLFARPLGGQAPTGNVSEDPCPPRMSFSASITSN